MQEISQKIEAYQKTNIFDFDNSLVLRHYPKRIFEILSLEHNGDLGGVSLLELGLGHGYSAELFMTYFSDYTILDGDARIIKRFKEEHQKNNVNIIQTYFETFEADRKYDIIVAGYVLEHVDDPEMILRKYGGILKEDGRLFITVPNATSMHRQLGYYAGELTDMMALSRMDLELGHKRYFTVNSLRELVKRSGFSAEAVEGLFLKPVTTRQMISLKFDKKYLEAFCRIGKDYPELCSGILMECKYRKG